MSVSCVAAASQALSVSPPGSLMSYVTDSIYFSALAGRYSFHPCSAVRLSSRARRAWFAKPQEREGFVAGTSAVDELHLALVFGWRLAAEEDLQQKGAVLTVHRCTKGSTGTR